MSRAYETRKKENPRTRKQECVGVSLSPGDGSPECETSQSGVHLQGILERGITKLEVTYDPQMFVVLVNIIVTSRVL